jgi:hypothetical protein
VAPKNRRLSAAGFIISFFLIGSTRMIAMPEDLGEIARRLPEKIAGWTKTGPPVPYTPQSLSTYIDGGAELFLSYNFKGALSIKYKGTGEDEIAVDVFDMGSSPDAFGVFAHSREAVDAAFGQGSEYAAGLLTFWKDRYYVSILAYPETAAKRDIVFTLGRTIAEAIPRQGALPPILALLPPANLLPESVHYFHHYIWLNSFYFVSNENVLNIGNDTPAALAKYKPAGAAYFLLLVRYPDAAKAEAAAAQFGQKVLGGAADGLREMKPGRWTGLQRRGDLLGIVFSAPDQAAIRDLFAAIKE